MSFRTRVASSGFVRGRWVTAACLVLALLVPAGLAFGQEQAPSLYKRLGGYDAIAAVVDDFLVRLRDDPKFGRFGGGRATGSLKRARQLIVEQICEAAGGPCFYIGRDMKSSHAGLQITTEEWESAGKHMAAALDKFKVPEKEKGEVLALIEKTRADIVEVKDK